MKFVYSRYTDDKKERILERVLETFPGILSWSIILGMLTLSFLKPLIAALIMIAFVLYWVLRLFYMNIFLVLSYIRLAIENKISWMERIRGIDRLQEYITELKAKKTKGILDSFSNRICIDQLDNLSRSDDPPPGSEEIYHLVIIPAIKETREIIEPGIKSIKDGSFPSKNILIVLAVEESASQNVKKDALSLKDTYKSYFLDILVTFHPNNIPGEARVKGANTTFAAKQAALFFKEAGIAEEKIIVSCFDSDTIAKKNYFSCLTYHYMITPGRNRASYQPIPVYHNNIWEAPSFARIIDIGTSFFELIEATNPGKLVTFSSHSMSFKALIDIGYWPVDMISDDSAIFWKAFIHYDGNYRTIPIYTTVSMDIATGQNLGDTFINIYKQKRRWAWGVENFPIVIRAFLKDKAILLYKKIIHAFKLLDAFISWATWSFLLAFISWLPAVFAGKQFSSSTVYYMAPRIRGTLFSLASIGLMICIILSLLLLPKRKVRYGFLKRLKHVLEWFFIPVFVLMLSALPALDAQTRLMFRKYMSFWVAGKRTK